MDVDFYAAEEQESVEISEDEIRQGLTECRNSCYGRFICQDNEGMNLIEDLLYVLNNGDLWDIDDHLLILKKWEQGSQPKLEDFDKVFFWINIVGLSTEFYTKEVAEKLAKKSFNQCTDVQLKENAETGERFIRLRAMVDMKKPIRRLVRLIGPEKREAIGLLKYEKLPIFCFQCGVIGHSASSCKHVKEKMEEVKEKLMTERIQGELVWMQDLERNVETEESKGSFSEFSVEKETEETFDQVWNVSSNQEEPGAQEKAASEKTELLEESIKEIKVSEGSFEEFSLEKEVTETFDQAHNVP
ncbi:OLC1v1031723C1 [Oldenlandia corymbosa var. corymbosa]|uniref:OLC1v1031723C1 n=1 Tax=Oldenlandia corymbosa var. corymbosa TaxID=529605 RepID=A0AAV1CMD3_OLDCO|nr:OLC1v1031723C1 [Oldenlandia corymbosa var. corymbosa]